MNSIIKASLDAYARDGRPTGGFLQAVLENNLMGAFERADIINKHYMEEIVGYVYNYLPAACHGSPENVRAWLANKAEERKNAQPVVECQHEFIQVAKTSIFNPPYLCKKCGVDKDDV